MVCLGLCSFGVGKKGAQRRSLSGECKGGGFRIQFSLSESEFRQLGATLSSWSLAYLKDPDGKVWATPQSRASVVVSSFQNFCAEEMLARSFSEWASSMSGPKEIMSRLG